MSRILRVALTVLILGLLFPATGQAAITFVAEPPSPYAAGTDPLTITNGDFNGDTLLDLVAVNGTSSNASVYLRQATGGFLPEMGSPFGTGGGPSHATVADFNADGRNDLAVANFTGSSVSILLRQAGGGFTAEALPPDPGGRASAIAAADFNGDGKQDLAVARWDFAQVRIFLRKATNDGFTNEGDSTTGTHPRQIAVADFDANGRPDLAIANIHSDNVTVLQRQNATSFSAPSLITVGDEPASIVTGDFNGDSRPDFATADNLADKVTVRLRLAAGGFSSAEAATTVTRPLGLGAADFDGDGGLDIATGNNTTSSVTILRRNATRDGFEKDPADPVPTIAGPNAVTVGDFDRDGGPDIALVSPVTDQLAVLRNADADHDGVPEASDNCKATPNPAQDDLDGDGIGSACDADEQVTTPGPGPDLAPTTKPATINVTSPTITGPASNGRYTCNPGTWRNIPSGQSFRYSWISIRNGIQAVSVSSIQTYLPTAADYGNSIYCQVTVRGNANADVFARSEGAVFSSAGRNKLPRAYGDVRIRGIDIAQIVQPNAGTRKYNYGEFGSLPSWCGAGVPTNYLLPGCGLASGKNAQTVDYGGVSLDSFKRTTAVVYLDIANQTAGDPNLTYDIELSATRNGASVGAPVVRTIKAAPPRSNTPYVLTHERDTKAFGQQVPLPSTWTTAGNTTITARVKFPNPGKGTAGFGTRQCDSGCTTNDSFTLRNIPFLDLPQIIIKPVKLDDKAGDPLPLPTKVMSTLVRGVLPGGERLRLSSSYAATLDISADAQLSALPWFGSWLCTDGSIISAEDIDQAWRFCRMNAVSARLMTWIQSNPGRQLPTRFPGSVFENYDVVMGVHNYTIPDKNLATNEIEPGWCCPDADLRQVNLLNPVQASTTPYLTVTAGGRPYSAVAHEFGHFLSAPHAGSSTDCKAPGAEFWSPENRGRMQSVRFPPYNPLTNGFIPDVDGENVAAPGAFAFPKRIFDLMSYCAGTDDTDAFPAAMWLSAFNWNRFMSELRKAGNRVGFGDRPRVFFSNGHRARAAGAAANQGFAVGTAGPGGGAITRVVPPDGVPGGAGADPSSPFHLRSLGASGQVLLDVGVTVRPNSEAQDSGSGPFIGPVAAGAASVELTYNGTVLSKLTRSDPPAVKLAVPAGGTRVKRGATLPVRWTASDPNGGKLNATVDFSGDGGKSWETLSDGPNSGSFTVPANALPATREGRIRVTVSDGFAQGTATSGNIVADGAAPQVQISSPLARAVVRVTDRVTLAGTAVDDEGRAITGKALTWFAGKKRLGTGARLRTSLPAGTSSIRLIAKDGSGRTATAAQSVRVEKVALQLADVTVPLKVGKSARTMTVTVRATAAATLTAAGKRYRVGTKATKITVRLPAKPAVGVLDVPFTLTSRDSRVSGTVRGRFSTART